MNNKELKRLQDYVKKRYAECNMDYQTFSGDIDTGISFIEQKNIIDEQLNTLLPKLPSKREAIMLEKAKERAKEQEDLSKYEKLAEEEFNKALEKIGNQQISETIDDIFFIPREYTKMVALGFARGFLLYGEAGLGKTSSVMRAFKELNKPLAVLSGHITSLELYHFLFEHKDEHIVLDDMNILETEQNLNLLKACLGDNSRVVSYNTSSSKLRVPNKFVFNGTITLLLNKIPKGAESLKAVESRILTYELKMDYKTKIKVIFELIKQDYKEISETDRLKIAKWIKDNTNQATENLNLRLLFMCYEFFRFDKENWIRLASKSIKTNEELQLIVQGLSQEEWCSKTGKSRASFFNYKKSMACANF